MIDRRTIVHTGLVNAGARARAVSRTYQLQVLAEPAQTAALGARPVLIGAHASCDVVLTDAQVSRKHAELTALPDGVRVRDLGSTNGTWWQGARITEVVVTTGSTVTFGTTPIRISAGPAPVVPPSPHDRFGAMVGTSVAMRELFAVLELAGPSDATVLVEGESGTGKELVAQAIHNAGPRAGGPFVGINCSAIPRELLESELFGYEAGAFTGAKKGGHPGKFELAEGGTILLDEIGDMPLEMQVKLLRVLQEKRLTRVGGMREVRLDARVIATTHRELTSEVERGSFRQDLFYRLKVIAIELPSLRERVGDIPMLVEHFLGLFAARLGKRVRGVTPQVMAALEGYGWPGNIRELEHVLESEINLATDDQLLLDEIPDAIRPRARKGPIGAVGAAGHDVAEPGRRVVGPADVVSFEAAERELLLAALAQHQGRVPEVARALGVSRGTVYNKLRKFQIDPTDYRGS